MNHQEPSEGEMASRVRKLEERVAALESRAAPLGESAGHRDSAGYAAPAGDAGDAAVAGDEAGTAQSETPPAPPDANDTFWVLNGLKSRIPDPGAVVFAGAVTGEGNRHYEFQYGLTTDAVLELDWSGFAGSLAALGHPVRLRILHGVLGGTGTVAGLAEELDAGTTGQLYHHVNQLVSQGWLVAAGRGHYQIPAGRVVPLLAIVAAAGV